MKHHVYMDFTPFHIKQPTFINVARDPVSLFASKFYFERFEWTHSEYIYLFNVYL